MLRKLIGAAAIALAAAAVPAKADTVTIANVSELSGAGAAAGTNWRDGVALAFEEINADGGILGRQVNLTQYDTQTDAQTSRAMVQKAIDEDAYVIMGTIFSGSTIVNMLVSQQNGVPQFTGSEAPNITAMGNPYIFRTSFGAQKGVPKVAAFVNDELKAKKVAVSWVNNEFGKGGRDAFVAAMQGYGIEVVADVPSESGQADFAADVVRLKGANPDAIFIYLNEEESARILRELRRQDVNVPLIGETTLIGHKVIELAGDAANGVLGHVGLTPDVEAIRPMADKFEAKYRYVPDHNAIKGYIGAYAVKYITEIVGDFDREKFIETAHGLTLKAADHPGMLLDTGWDENGEMLRESFLAEVVGGKQQIKSVLPAN